MAKDTEALEKNNATNPVDIQTLMNLTRKHKEEKNEERQRLREEQFFRLKKLTEE